MGGSATGRSGAVLGLTAALLFGSSAPLSKLLLPSSGPLELAGLLYTGGGLGLVVFGLLRRASPAARIVETPIRRQDMPLLAGVVLMGGILGPVLMLTGLERLSAVAGSLLLNLEAPFTILLAVGVFVLLRGRHGHEHVHEAIEHEHMHVHDEHHQHEHARDEPVVGPHSHVHRHGRLVHDHPHVSDLHHRHEHV